MATNTTMTPDGVTTIADRTEAAANPLVNSNTDGGDNTPNKQPTPNFDPADTNKDGKIDATELATADAKRSAYDVIVNMFNDAGAPALGQWLKGAIQGDPNLLTNQNELFNQLQNSDPYKQRFSGLVKLRDYNAKNPTNPVAVPSESQYLATEAQMKQILSPVASMYGDTIDAVVGNLIGSQISPVEVQSRVNVANAWVMNTDPNVKAALQQYYGVDDTHLLQYALDPERGTSEIQKAAGTVQLGAEALANHVSITQQQSEGLIQQLMANGQANDMQQAGQIASQKLQDITSGTATAYNPNAGTLKNDLTLSKIEGGNLQAADVLGAALGTNTQAATDITGLKSRERARFNQGQGGTNVLQQNVSGSV